MKKKIFVLLSLFTMTTLAANSAENPFFSPYKTPFEAPAFDRIKPEYFMPAFQEGIRQHDAEIAAIANSKVAPTFKNTLEAFDYSGKFLKKVSGVFFALTEAETNKQIDEIAEKITPVLTEHGDNIYLNAKLYARIKKVYDQRAKLKLTPEQARLLDKVNKDFVRSGAALNAKDQARLREINKQLSSLMLKFSDNGLKETNAFKLVLDKKEDLAGLPQSSVEAAAEEAKDAGLDGKWLFTLHKPSLIPFLQYSEKRDLREKMFKGYINRGDNDNASDNKAVINKIVNLRIEKANLLGFPNHAAYVLDECMAQTPDRVMTFLNKIWKPAVAKARVEANEMQAMIDAENGGFKLQPWDWWYYSEKIRKARFNLDESEIKPYFKLENVRQGAFDVAGKLYGLKFKPLKDVPVYHPDVEAFEVLDADGSHVGVLYTDYFPRPGKRAGAWMGNFTDQYIQNGVDSRPLIYNVGNFTKPTSDAPSLLNQDEVETLFHEFGHALHGLLTKCHYFTLSGTNVPRDFVELPSQIMENWAMYPEVLKMYAKHYKTGATIPDDLIAKIQNTSTFNQGFITTELVSAAILDMDWHVVTGQKEFDVRSFEKEAMNSIGLIDEIVPRYRSTFFNHIFSGSYSAGYYAYLWAEVLDADAFDLFVQKGVFDEATAKAFRKNVLEKGNTEDPMTLYRRFRGAEPNPESLMKRRGL